MTELGVKVRVEPPTRMGMRRVVLLAFAAVGLLRVLVVTRKGQMKRSWTAASSIRGRGVRARGGGFITFEGTFDPGHRRQGGTKKGEC